MRSVLRHRDFRLFFAGRSIGNFGDQLSPVALAFAVLGLTRRPDALGLVLAAQVLPEALLVLVGGAVADRWNRRKLMIVTDVARFALQALTAGLLLGHVATIRDLLLIQVSYGAATAFFAPTQLGFIPELVPADQLQAANSLNGLTTSVATIMGPALGGLLVALGSPGTALAVDAATFALSAFTLARMEVTPPPPVGRTSMAKELVEGWRELTRQHWVWVLIVFWGIYQSTVLSGYQVLGPVLSERHLGGAGAWATILVSRGIGSVVAGVVGLRLQPRRPILTGVLVLVLDAPLLLLLSLAAPLPWDAAAAAFEGGGQGLSLILWYSALQDRVPARAQSRVFAYDRLGSIGMQPVGLLAVGAIATAVGDRATLEVVAAVYLALMLPVICVRGVRQRSSIPPPPAGETGG